jgi:hypothetical protein
VTFQWVTADSSKKILLCLDSPAWLCPKRLARSLSSFHELSCYRWTLGKFRVLMSEKYTEGSRISQGFVGCNRNAAVERSSVANGLESTRLKMENYRRSPVVGFSASRTDCECYESQFGTGITTVTIAITLTLASRCCSAAWQAASGGALCIPALAAHLS